MPVHDASKNKTAPTPGKHRRRFLLIGAACIAALAVALLGRPLWHIVATAWHDVDEVEKIPPGFTDDASRMNRPRVAEVVPVEADPPAPTRHLPPPPPPPPTHHYPPSAP